MPAVMTLVGQSRRTVFAHDRFTGRLRKSGRMTCATDSLTKQYATAAAAMGMPCHGQMKCPTVPPNAWCATPAACIAIAAVAVFTKSGLSGRGWSESASRREMVPVDATSVAAYGPRSRSDVNSIVKEAGITARSSVAAWRIASVEARMAARIRPQNSRVRCGCGQPASPRSIPAAKAIAAKANTRE
jgi:hypothetical protein